MSDGSEQKRRSERQMWAVWYLVAMTACAAVRVGGLLLTDDRIAGVAVYRGEPPRVEAEESTVATSGIAVGFGDAPTASSEVVGEYVAVDRAGVYRVSALFAASPVVERYRR